MQAVRRMLRYETYQTEGNNLLNIARATGQEINKKLTGETSWDKLRQLAWAFQQESHA